MFNINRETINFVLDMQYIANELAKVGNNEALKVLAKYDIKPTAVYTESKPVEAKQQKAFVEPAIPFETKQKNIKANDFSLDIVPEEFNFDKFLLDEIDKVQTKQKNVYDIYLDSCDEGGYYKIMKGDNVIKEQKVKVNSAGKEELVALGSCSTNPIIKNSIIRIHYHQDAVKNVLENEEEKGHDELNRRLNNVKYELIAA